MLALVPLFLPQLSEAARSRTSERRLEAALGRFLKEARAPWPTVVLADDVFLNHVADHLSDEEEPLGVLRTLHAGDLYLACACARGDAVALAIFEKAFMSEVPAYLVGRRPTRSFIDEVQQRLRTDNLVQNGARPAGIAGYAGRGPLRGWLQVAALRAATKVDVGQRRPGGVPITEMVAEPANTRRADPELEFLRAHFADVFRAAVEGAIASLSVQEANILRLSFIDGLTQEQVARSVHVSLRTIKRRLASTREKVMSETRRRLVEGGRLTASQLTGLMDVMSADLDVTLIRLLQR